MPLTRMDTDELETVVNLMSGENGQAIELWVDGSAFLTKDKKRTAWVDSSIIKQFIDMDLMYPCTPPGRDKHKTVWRLRKKNYFLSSKALERKGFLLKEARK